MPLGLRASTLRCVRDELLARWLNGKSPGLRRGFRDPAGARTQDPDIKSVVLYQLSYRISNGPFLGTGAQI